MAFVVRFVPGICGIQIQSPVRDDLFVECVGPLNLLAPFGAAYLSQITGADEFLHGGPSSTRPDYKYTYRGVAEPVLHLFRCKLELGLRYS